MKTRIYIYIITVILYNLWILLNFIIKQTRVSRYRIKIVDFIYIIKKKVQRDFKNARIKTIISIYLALNN